MNALEVLRRLLEDEGEDYTPSPHDIAWQKQNYASLRDGGAWAVPACQSVWVVDKANNGYVLKFGDPEHPLNQRIKAVMEAAGFNVVIGGEVGGDDIVFVE